MTYEKYKTGTFRVSVFLTILGEYLAFSGVTSSSNVLTKSTKILGMHFDALGLVVLTLPIFVFVTYFFSLWIAKGYMGEK